MKKILLFFGLSALLVAKNVSAQEGDQFKMKTDTIKPKVDSLHPGPKMPVLVPDTVYNKPSMRVVTPPPSKDDMPVIDPNDTTLKKPK